MGYESKPDTPEHAGESKAEEPVKEEEKKKLFGLTEDELAELDKKDPEKYWNN